MANITIGPITADCSNTAANWTFNDLGKNPCQVASFLAQACVPDLPPIPPLIQGNAYSGPGTPAQSNQCICSSVTYSMVAACSYCQNGLYRNWAGDSSWSQNCSSQDLSVGKYPLTIVQNFSVPIWAYLNISATNTWDLNAAHQLAGSAPDITGLNAPTFSSAAAVPTGLSLPGPELPTFTPAQTTPVQQKSDVGPIVGGILGGLLGLLACIVGAILFLRYRSHDKSKTAPPMAAKYDSQSMAYQSNGQSYSTRHSRYQQPKLYDPSDPSTFPVTPSPTAPTASTTNGYSAQSRSSTPSNRSSAPSQGKLHSPLRTYPNAQSGREWFSPVPEL